MARASEPGRFRDAFPARGDSRFRLSARQLNSHVKGGSGSDGTPRLRAALGRAQYADYPDAQSDWTNDVSAAIYASGSVAVELLRHYWHEGLLCGAHIAGALDEVGYADESPSHGERRSLLMDALTDPDPDVRYAAAQGLVHLADPTTQAKLTETRRAEANPIVRLQLDDAIDVLDRHRAS